MLVPNEAMAGKKAELESFLYDRVYRHDDVLRMRAGAQDALRRLFADVERRSQLGSAARQAARSYCWEAEAPRLLALYDSL